MSLVLLTLLFLPGLVTDCRAELQSGAVGQRAASRTDHHAETRLLQDLTVVVIGVSHCPAGEMSLSILIFSYKQTAVTVSFKWLVRVSLQGQLSRKSLPKLLMMN